MTTYHPLSDAERRDMELYGPCEVCGTARTTVMEYAGDGRLVGFGDACPSCDRVPRNPFGSRP